MISLAEYVQRISRRMYALERAEPPPRIMPYVLAISARRLALNAARILMGALQCAEILGS